MQAHQTSAGLRQASGDPSGRQLDFSCGDILSPDCPTIQAGALDAVICQLVISIIGTAHDRAPCLRIYTKYIAPEAISIFQHRASPMTSISCMQSFTSQTQKSPMSSTLMYLAMIKTKHVLTASFSEEELHQLLHHACFRGIRIDRRRETAAVEWLSLPTSLIVTAGSFWLRVIVI